MRLSKKIPMQIPSQIPDHSHGHLPRGKFIRYTVWLIYRALYKTYSSEECGMNCQKPWVNTSSIAKLKALVALSVGFRIRMRKAQGKYFAYRRVSGLFFPPLSKALSSVSAVALWFLPSPKDLTKGLWWCASGKRGTVKNIRDLRSVTSDPASPWAVGLLRAARGVHPIGLYQGDWNLSQILAFSSVDHWGFGLFACLFLKGKYILSICIFIRIYKQHVHCKYQHKLVSVLDFDILKHCQ